VALEEQDVHGNHDTCHCNHVQRGGCRPSHGATLAFGSDEARLGQWAAMASEHGSPRARCSSIKAALPRKE
jgi:hypothetical protein